MTSHVNQSRASAQGDIVAGNKIKIERHYHGPPVGIVEQLLEKLQDEMENNPQSCDVIERLQRFYKGRTHDDVIGLEAKLQAGGREDEYEDALERKEMFVKLLEQWALYASAQLIFAHLLARAEHHFKYMIYPSIKGDNTIEINLLTNQLIIEPTVKDCGSSVFAIDHNVAMGMVYWLAEQCFVRWHR
jgi:hypothetical protein